MPKGGKKGQQSRHKRIQKFESDITLKDCANAATSVGRLKKSSNNSLTQVQKIKSDTEVDWFDKDFSEHESDRDEDSTTTNNISVSTIEKGKSKVSKLIVNDKCITYPLDVWFLIGQYIRPEDVTTFACICKSSLYVVNSTKLWIRFYKRYYSDNAKLPERLQKECIERPNGLRKNIVRALFCMYPPFIERIRNAPPFDSIPKEKLAGMQCLLMWYQRIKEKNQWQFNFRLGSRDRGQQFRTTVAPSRPDLLEMISDIHANPDAGCKVLQLTVGSFVSTPAVMGMYLSNFHFSLAQDMRNHKLHLTFHLTPYQRGRQTSVGTVQVVFDSVIMVRVLDWWHPLYPPDC